MDVDTNVSYIDTKTILSNIPYHCEFTYVVNSSARMGEERGVHRALLGKPEGRRPLGRPRHRWVDIRMDLQEVGCGVYGLDWVGPG